MAGRSPILSEATKGGPRDTARTPPLAPASTVIRIANQVAPVAAARLTALATHPEPAGSVETVEEEKPGLDPASVEANPDIGEAVAEAPQATEITAEVQAEVVQPGVVTPRP